MRTGLVRISTCLLSMTVTIWAGDGADGVFRAIRDGDISFLRDGATKAMLESRGNRGATPLMHAAAFGNLATVKLLLDRGADVNAHNDFGATALLWGARDAEKARLLIERGADVNARSRQGRTPLMLASLREGGSSIVGLLLEKGAEVNVKDGRGDTALGLAASIGEAPTMRLLLARGADTSAVNRRGETPLILASKSKSDEAVRLLIKKGVDVNAASTAYNTVRNGPIAMVKLTALHHAASFGPPQMVRDLLDARAEVNARDSRSLTPLIFAVATEYPSAAIVRMLIAAGVEVNARDSSGETALDWAEKFGYPEILAELKKAGAEHGAAYKPPARPAGPAPQAAAALARSMALLEKSSGEFFKNGGCVGCHHQPLIARAQGPARKAGAPVNESAAREQTSQLKAQWLASQEEFLQSLNPGGGANRLGEGLLGLEASGYPADAITDAAIVDLAEAQAADGSWNPGDEQPRPPITESVIASTARSIRAVKAYTIPARKQEFEARVARAREWLKQAKASSTDDFAMRLFGLSWAGAPPSDLQSAARALIALQREDGGWAGNPYLPSDAFSTGESLVALAESGTDPAGKALRRGLEYLLKTQYPDGSWYVRSRAIKFQPYFESGFPFGHDQWISAAGTGWAAQAISLTAGR